MMNWYDDDGYDDDDWDEYTEYSNFDENIDEVMTVHDDD